MAVSINLLDFYQALFEKSCDAVNALASALNTFYTRRGFISLNAKVCNKTMAFLTRLVTCYRANRFWIPSADRSDMRFSGTTTYNFD